MVDARDRRDQHRRAGDGARRRRCTRSSRTSSRTSRTRPATRSRAAKRKRLLELAVEHDFTIFEDDPYVAIRFEGEHDRRRCSRQDDAGRVVYASLVLQDRLPGHPRRLPGRPAGGHQADPDDRDQHLHLAEHGRPVDRQPVRPLRADGRRDRRRSRPRCAPAATRSITALERELPEAKLRAPAGRLLHVGRAARGGRRGRAGEGRGRARGAVRQGHGLPARGRPEHAAPGLLRRDAGADRRGHHASSPRPLRSLGVAAA